MWLSPFSHKHTLLCTPKSEENQIISQQLDCDLIICEKILGIQWKLMDSFVWTQFIWIDTVWCRSNHQNANTKRNKWFCFKTRICATCNKVAHKLWKNVHLIQKKNWWLFFYRACSSCREHCIKTKGFLVEKMKRKLRIKIRICMCRLKHVFKMVKHLTKEPID